MAVKSSFKNMTLCLLVICLVCSALLAGVYALTKETIETGDAQRNEAAIKEVLPETAVTIEKEDTIKFENASYTYNLAYDKEGNTVGCAINVEPNGFGGPIKMKVGLNSEGIIWNVKVLSHAETPGLGAKCKEPGFSEQFRKFDPAAKKLAVTKDGGDVNAITASTITSRAYVEGLALAVKLFDAIGKEPDPLAPASEEPAAAPVDTVKTIPVDTVIPSDATTVIPSEVEESK